MSEESGLLDGASNPGPGKGGAPEVGPGLKPGESISRPPRRGEAPAGEGTEYRATIAEAIREVEVRSGATGFVSADRADEAHPRVVEPQRLLESIERAGARLGVAAELRPVYTIGEGGSIVNTVTGRTEYLPVHGQGAKADLARTHAATPEAGGPGEGARPGPEAQPVQASAGERREVRVDERIYASPGAAPRDVARQSHYGEPIAHPEGEPSGDSRRHGDADRETQRRCMDLIIAKGREYGMTDHEIALALAIGRVESGFNPDAAAGSTSASGLGQLIDATSGQYGITATNRWSAEAQADALVRHTQDNLERARAHGHGGADLDRYTYAYHHDGPSLAYGGLGIADASVVPNVAMYEQYVRTH